MSSPLQLQVYTSPIRQMVNGKNTFSPTTSSLLFGDSEALLVDTQFVTEDVDAVGDMIELCGARLTTIVVTHAHADHYLGTGRLLERYPDARAVTLPSIVASIEATHEDQVALSRQLLGGDCAGPNRAIPEPLDRNVLQVDGHEVRILEVGQGDIAPSAIVHVPSLAAVIAGDVAYNRIHAMLAYSSAPQWQRWIDSLDAIDRLNPSIVVAGHKQPDAADSDVASIVGGTRQYIRDFARITETATSTRDVVAAMRERYPGHGNVTTLIASAAAATRSRPAVRT